MEEASDPKLPTAFECQRLTVNFQSPAHRHEGGPADWQRQNRKRVRPPGSAPKVTIAERGSMRYTFQGGGPCDGALNGAVMPGPLASGSAGQPLCAHAFAIPPARPGSVTRADRPPARTPGVRRDIAPLPGACPRLEPERAVKPQGTDRSHMRAAVLVDGGETGRAGVHRVRRWRRP